MTSADEQPRGQESEAFLRTLCCDLLEVERLGRDDDLLDLGADSLVLAQLVNHVLDAYGVELPLDQVFDEPTIGALADAIDELAGGGAPAPVPVRRSGEAESPLTPTQYAMWAREKLHPGTPQQNTRWALRIRGPLDAAALGRALGDVVARHESLRTRFVSRGREVLAQVREDPLPELPVVALPGATDDALQRRVAEHVQTPMDLADDLLFRPLLLAIGPEDHVLALSIHHIVFDGWSFGVLLDEVCALYEARSAGGEASLDDLPVQFGDLARLRSDGGDPRDEEDLAYFRKHLAGPPARLELPADDERADAAGWCGARLFRAVGMESTEELRSIAQDADTTLFVALLSGFAAMLHARSGCEDLVLGSFASGRRRVEAEPLIGAFLNTVVLRLDLAGDPSFEELLARNRRVVLDAQVHQGLPFETLVRALRPPPAPGRPPFFDVAFQLRNFPPGRRRVGALELEELALDTGIARFPLFVEATAHEGGVDFSYEYAVPRYSEATAAKWADALEAILEAATEDPGIPLSRLVAAVDAR